MSERKAGWYWVKPPFGQWVAANWNPEYEEAFSYWEMPGTEEGFGDDHLLEIVHRTPHLTSLGNACRWSRRRRWWSKA